MEKKFTKEQLEGKFIIAYDTICDGWQCAKDEDENPDPVLYNSYDEAFKELFEDNVDMLVNRTDSDRREVGVSSEIFKEMKAVSKTGDIELMKSFLKQNEQCNYNDEFIVPADEFILGRKAIFTGNGGHIEGEKLY